MQSRREFIKRSSLATTAALVPQFLKGFEGMDLTETAQGKVLVVIQFGGGNDGLNTIVPYRNDLYYKARPSIAVSPKEVLKVNDELGFNPALKALRSVFDQGWLSIINNVGYPNPVRSHFRSMDIWATASDSEVHLQTGWLGRYLDSSCQGCDADHHIVNIGEQVPLAIRGEKRNGFAVGNLSNMQKAIDNLQVQSLPPSGTGNDEVAFLYKTLTNTISGTQYLSNMTRTRNAQTPSYPNHPFSSRLKQIGELIIKNIGTKVYYVEHGSFDTHDNQIGKHNRLLSSYAEGIKSFTDHLRKHGKLNDTLIVTFSEFGRRVAENGAKGTDHGTANNMFLISGSLKQAGIYNDGPDLENLQEGDLKHQLDFRQVYATVLDKWLGADSRKILGHPFKTLPII